MKKCESTKILKSAIILSLLINSTQIFDIWVLLLIIFPFIELYLRYRYTTENFCDSIFFFLFFQGLNLDDITTHHWLIQDCSAVTGENLLEGIDWVVDDIASRIFTMDWYIYKILGTYKLNFCDKEHASMFKSKDDLMFTWI